MGLGPPDAFQFKALLHTLADCCLQGKGFPTLSLGLTRDDIRIMIAGVPCAVTSSTFTQMECVTGAEMSYTPTPVNGLLPGARGEGCRCCAASFILCEHGGWWCWMLV